MAKSAEEAVTDAARSAVPARQNVIKLVDALKATLAAQQSGEASSAQEAGNTTAARAVHETRHT